MRYPFIAGNWKMYKTTRGGQGVCTENSKKFISQLTCRSRFSLRFTQLTGSGGSISAGPVSVSAHRTCTTKREGAFTGEISDSDAPRKSAWNIVLSGILKDAAVFQ